MMHVLLVVALVILGLGAAPEARAQVGNPADVNANPHPVLPWAAPWSWRLLRPYGDVVQIVDVAPRFVEVPTEVPREPRAVVVPGYRVTETTLGYWVHPHWGLRPSGEGVYLWTWIAGYFWPK
jgi:hypothetical protein